MAFGGGWFIADLVTSASKTGSAATLARNILKNSGVLPVLLGPGGKKAQHSVAFANPWMIFKQTQHPKEAKIFLDWLMSKKTLSRIYAAAPGGVWPVYKSVVKTRAFTANPLVKAVAEQETKRGVDYWYPYNKGAIGVAGLGTGIADYIVNPVLTGARTPQDALKDAQTKLSPLFR
jgi:ABC-type glycerol-3-phosphate transport system substrate-binding protein